MKRGDKDERGFCNKFAAKKNSRFVPFIIRFSWKKLKAEPNGHALLSPPVASLWVLVSPFICSFSSVVLSLDNSCAYRRVFLCFYWACKTRSACNASWLEHYVPHLSLPRYSSAVAWCGTVRYGTVWYTRRPGEGSGSMSYLLAFLQHAFWRWEGHEYKLYTVWIQRDEDNVNTGF